MSESAYEAVVLYFRLGDRIAETLRALQQQSVPPSRIVLVDNASGDGIVDELSRGGILDGIEVLTLPSNLGYAGGMNAGIAQLAATSGPVLLLTHEVRLAPTCVQELLPLIDGGAVACAPTLELDDGRVWSRGGRITRTGNALPGRPPRTDDGLWLDGACVMVDRQTLAVVGGLDERFFLYWEDVDTSLALRGLGPIRVAPAARAVQAQSSSNPPVYYYARNRLLVWRKHRRWLLLLLSVPACLAYGAYRGVRVHPQDAWLALRGVIDGLRGVDGPRPQLARWR